MRPVICLETNQHYKSMRAAAQAIGRSVTCFRRAISDGSTVGGLHFYFADEEKPDERFFFHKKPLSPKPIMCIETGEVFASHADAERKLGINAGRIAVCAHEGDPAHGLHFRPCEIDGTPIIGSSFDEPSECEAPYPTMNRKLLEWQASCTNAALDLYYANDKRTMRSVLLLIQCAVRFASTKGTLDDGRQFCEMSHRQIASELGWSQSRVKTALAAAEPFLHRIDNGSGSSRYEYVGMPPIVGDDEEES